MIAVIVVNVSGRASRSTSTLAETCFDSPLGVEAEGDVVGEVTAKRLQFSQAGILATRRFKPVPHVSRYRLEGSGVQRLSRGI